ncbi:hypothetical protein BDY17DRAFT_126046 [Neohortaea acidophila]|uniref:Uncharacterized protein n=1 Tax=Neohortaea acidophila TaxID=245834 RepID=A0A6A6PW12_9PEZI|nr:uncharacterized protein BDY17DRAFT_126046 [Neohortaea acidophila]KAF2484330.1 hypothetical protein BDY17DRAFT_126046 [Neohortaea acidophila]
MARGTRTQQIIVATPDWMDYNFTVYHGKPPCYDYDTCYDFCLDEDRDMYPIIGPTRYPTAAIDFENGDAWYIAACVAAAFILLLGSLCCCAAALRRRRTNSLSEKLGRKLTQLPTEIIVNQATGTAVDTATGQPVDPSTATAVISGSAAGAEAGRKQSTMTTSGNDDGKGTSARRAEEGRGRVNFEDGGRPGNEAPPPERTTVTEVEPAPQPAPAPAPAPATETERTERVETKPAGQTDGTFDLATTGRQILDTGSMRGRKRGRVEGAAKGPPFGF